MVELHGRQAFPLVDFDLPSHEYRDRITAVAADLGLAGPVGDRSFFDPALRHATSGEPMDIPARAADLYAELRSLVG